MARRSDPDTEDRESAEPGIPDPDFCDTRPWLAAGASVWGVPERGDLEGVGEALDGVLGRFAGSSGAALQEINAIWDSVTGPEWSTARPARLDGDTLIVEVPDGTVASRLRFDSPRVVAALRSVAGGRVKRARFRVARR